MDAYAYIAHGHVFANAQTGNVVLFAVSAAGGRWDDAPRHLPPILACILGVSAAKLLGARSTKHSFRATLLCQSIELAVRTGLAVFASRLSNSLVVPLISFTAALQITSFDALGPWSFNSAMTTGNIKSATTGLVLWMTGREPAKNKGKALVASVACAAFLTGCLFGSLYTLHNQAHALRPLVGLLSLGLYLTWRERRRRRSEAET